MMKSLTNKHFVAIFISLVICLISFSACDGDQPQAKKESTNVQGFVPDSIQKKIIDTMVDSINAGLRRIGAPQKLPYQLLNPTDTIYYWILDDHSARISLELSPPDGVIWPTFFIYKGDLVFVRYRYYTKSLPAPHAAESMIYLKDGKVVYCNERRIDLPGGSAPGNLKQVPFEVSKRTSEEISNDYLSNWKTVTTYMKEHHALPAGFKD